MDLTRRDALVALVGGGIVGAEAVERATTGGEDGLSDTDRRTIRAVAEVLYPSSVTVNQEFVDTFVSGRGRFDETYLENVHDALDVVRTTSRRETGRSFASLGQSLRDDVLRATGAGRAYSDPGGTTAQRVRYYLVDELLYAFYASPTGGSLVGNENPKGYPGGTDVYQQPPGEES